jgi:hypothetical protein
MFVLSNETMVSGLSAPEKSSNHLIATSAMTSFLPADIPTWVPACAGLYLLASIWLGWRRGLVREAASLLGILLGAYLGFWAGPFLAPAIPAFGFPAFLKPILSGVVLGILAWSCVMIFSSIIFRKTEEQAFGLIRFFYGVSGAGLGLISAVTMLCLGAWGVRCFGSFAEGLQPTSAKEHHGKPLHSQDSESAPLVSLKKALDNSPISDLLNKLDPLPQNFYPRLQKVAQLLTSPKAKERFMADPILAPLSKNSKLLALQSDPALLESLQSGDLWSIIRNPKVLAAASDAQLLTALRASELDKALDRALTSGGALPASPEPVKAAKTAPPPLRAKP